jgi:hypothetical protein
VLPLTSSSKGLGKGKIELGVLNCLPLRLRSSITYAAVNSIRTVNCSRFSPIHDNGSAVESKMDTEKLKYSLLSIINDMTFNTDEKLKAAIFKEVHINSSVKLLNNLLFKFNNETKNGKNKAVISKLKNEILDIMTYIPYKVFKSRIDSAVKPLAKKLFLRNYLKIVLTS